MNLRWTDEIQKVKEDGCILMVDTFKVEGASCNVIVKKMVHKDCSGGIIYKAFNIISDGEYIPEIYYEDAFWSNEKPHFEIQTVAYGAKTVDEIKRIIDGYQEAIKIVKLLELSFC